MENEKKTDLEAVIKTVRAQLCQHDVELDHIGTLLGYGSKNGSRAFMHLSRIDDLVSRLDALEASTIEYLSPDRATMVRVQDGVATWMTNDADGKTKVETVKPATVARDALKQAVHDGFKNGLNVDDLVAKATGYYGMATAEYQKIRADLSTNGIKMMTPDEVKANLRRDEPNVATINDLFDKIKDQAATVDALMGENAELFDQCDANAETIATLKTEIATRDRLLDDQAATIGKLERERDEAKALLQVVQTRVVGLDLNNIDKMRGQQWVKATRKKQQRVVCDFHGDPVTVPMSMPEMGIQELRSRIERGYSK